MSWELEVAKQITSFWANNPSMVFITYMLAIITTLFEYGFGAIIVGVSLLISKKTRRTGIILLIALSLFALIGNNLICKHVVLRTRPIWEDTSYLIKNNAETVFLPIEQRWLNLDFWAIPKQTSYSFMSGHTVASFLLATIVFMNYRKTGVALYLLAAITGFSRIYFGFHYISDVITGALYATATGLIAFFLYKKIEVLVLQFIKNKNIKNN